MSRPIQTATSSGDTRPNDAAIAKRAYELSLQRGSTPGHEIDDWLQAEAELLAATAKPNQEHAADPRPDDDPRADRAGEDAAPPAEPPRGAPGPRRGRDSGRRVPRQPQSH